MMTYAVKGTGRGAWVMADYSDMGSRLFSDITQVALSVDGMLALRSDGTVVGVANGTPEGQNMKKTLPTWRNIREVCSCDFTYLAV